VHSTLVEFSGFGHVHHRPVEVEQIDVFELHQLQSFFDLVLHAFSFQVEQFGGYKELLALDSALFNYCFDGFAQSDLVVVDAGGVNVAAASQLQAFS
jgi:hypothetical protein